MQKRTRNDNERLHFALFLLSNERENVTADFEAINSTWKFWTAEAKLRRKISKSIQKINDQTATLKSAAILTENNVDYISVAKQYEQEGEKLQHKANTAVVGTIAALRNAAIIKNKAITIFAALEITKAVMIKFA